LANPAEVVVEVPLPDHPEVPPTDIGYRLQMETDTQGGGGGAALTDEVLALPDEPAVRSDAATDPALPLLRFAVKVEEPAPPAVPPVSSESHARLIGGLILAVVAIGVMVVVIALLAR
jgi:hypothetical protein